MQPLRKRRETRTEPGAPAAAESHPDKAEKLKADLDSLIDEIDEMLEDNAEEMVKEFVQKGGE